MKSPNHLFCLLVDLLPLSCQAALRELTDKVVFITFKKFPRVSQEGVDGWAELNPPGKLIAEVIKSNW